MVSALAALLPALALAGAPVVVVETRVAQYRAAAQAAEKHLPGAVELEPSDPALAEKLAAAPVAVAVGRKALAAAREHAGKTPVVFCMVLGLSRGDLSESVTGLPLESDPAQVLARIHALVPGARRVGVVYDPSQSALLMERAQKAAGELGLELVKASASSAAQARDKLEGMLDKADVLWLVPDPRLYTRELSAYLIDAAAERRVPLVGFLDSFTQAGALASVSPNYGDLGDRAGKLAKDLAARPEAKRLPVPPPSYAPGDLSVNLATARVLGLSIDSDALSGAAQVIR